MDNNALQWKKTTCQDAAAENVHGGGLKTKVVYHVLKIYVICSCFNSKVLLVNSHGGQWLYAIFLAISTKLRN